MVSSTATGRPPRVLARPARVRPHGAPTRGTRAPSSRHPEARALPRDEMSSAGEVSEGGVRLLLVGSPPDVARVEAAAEACVAERRHLLVLFRGASSAEGGPSGAEHRNDEKKREEHEEANRLTRTTRDLESACDAIARVAPVLEFTPLLAECGWDAKHARARAEALARERKGKDVVVDDATGTSSDVFEKDENVDNVRASRGFAKVSVGGTFDRLHAGHRLLLAAAALATHKEGTLLVGVTGEALLANKSDKNKIQPYAKRANNAERFLESVWCPDEKNALMGGKKKIKTGPLDGSPPLASTVEDMRALVVSRETLGGAAAVNAQRRDLGFPPLEIIAVGVVGGVGDSDEARERTKLSSSALRAAAE